MLASMSRKAWPLPDISRPTSKPSVHAELLLHVGQRRLARIDGERDAHLPRQLEPVGVHVGDDDVARPGVAHDGRGHEADRAGAGDEHVFAEHVEGERGVDGVAEGIEDGGHVRVDPVGRAPRRWSSAGRCTRRRRPARLTPTPWVSLHRCRRPARQLRQRPQTTWPSPLTISPGWKSVTLEPTSTISPTNSWPDDHRHGDGLRRPVVPLVDVQVGAADAGAQDLDEHVVDAELRLGHVVEPEPAFGPALDQRFHRASTPEG